MGPMKQGKEINRNRYKRTTGLPHRLRNSSGVIRVAHYQMLVIHDGDGHEQGRDQPRPQKGPPERFVGLGHRISHGEEGRSLQRRQQNNQIARPEA